MSHRLRTTPAWSAARAQAQNEAIQLLYVGMTRARDQLILTGGTQNPVGKWLELLASPLLPITADTLGLPSGETIQCRLATLEASTPTVPGTPRTRHWLPPASPSAPPFLGYFAPPSAAPASSAPTCTLLHDFGRRIALTGAPQMDILGAALHHALAIALINPAVEQDSIAELLAQYPGVQLDAAEVLGRARALVAWIGQQYPGARLHCELPFSRMLPTGQLQSGQLDLALELTDGWVVIDHKSNPQPKREWLRLAAEHSGQLGAYAEAVSAISARPVLETLIHFSISGGLVRVAG